MQIHHAAAPVTGANRGLGLVFARALLDRGAKAVYGAARDPSAVTDPGVVPVALDVTDPAQVTVAAARCAGVDLLINNAAAMSASPLIGMDAGDGARSEMEVNYFGTPAMCRAFAPVLARNGGAQVNMLSVVSWFTDPASGSYSASQAAAWAPTNGVRVELRGQGTLVVGVHAGLIDTDMAAHVEAPRAAPSTSPRRRSTRWTPGRRKCSRTPPPGA
ncbi:SDR family NAD(P)-dependent oxidoreductase [Streptomyces pinistramenti]|uniref:SDR family NAD(P)-dependent oxidoreductase n=1 Tax=Streptomyces pinistramenti TaxID=2884812 RepID=UPI001D0856E4|nr:SDR family NAD(P)-dependent oxidoreductase [Streptomyces pinistramenti]MCB5906306.1 SDR family NAD(P)-dependent oxidoreductase [Streptomyces pinistramenti]